MVTSPEPSEEEGQIGKLRSLWSNTCHTVNLVKIGPVDPEIVSLKGLFQVRKKLMQEKHISRGYIPACMPRGKITKR